MLEPGKIYRTTRRVILWRSPKGFFADSPKRCYVCSKDRLLFLGQCDSRPGTSALRFLWNGSEVFCLVDDDCDYELDWLEPI